VLLLHRLTDVRNLGGAPSSRDFLCSRGYKKGFPVPLRASGELSADGAPPSVRAIGCPRSSARSDSFATPMAKGSRTQVVGSVREAPGGLPCVALFWYFSLATERKVRRSISPINCNLNLKTHPRIGWAFGCRSSRGMGAELHGILPVVGQNGYPSGAFKSVDGVGVGLLQEGHGAVIG